MVVAVIYRRISIRVPECTCHAHARCRLRRRHGSDRMLWPLGELDGAHGGRVEPAVGDQRERHLRAEPAPRAAHQRGCGAVLTAPSAPFLFMCVAVGPHELCAASPHGVMTDVCVDSNKYADAGRAVFRTLANRADGCAQAATSLTSPARWVSWTSSPWRASSRTSAVPRACRS